MKSKLTVSISVVVCLIILTAAVLPNFSSKEDIDYNDYSKVVNVSDNSFTDRLSNVAESLSHVCNVETDDSGDTIITCFPSISDIFPELDMSDTSIDLSIVEKDDICSYGVAIDETNLNSDNTDWEYVYSDDGELTDVIAVTDSGRISIKDQYDPVEECFCITLGTIAVTAVIALVAAVAAKEISDNGDSNDSDSDDGNGSSISPAVIPLGPTDPCVTVQSTTGCVGLSIGFDAARYYDKGNVFYLTSMAFKYSNCHWNEIVEGISISEYDDRLLAVAVNAGKYSIEDINNMGMGTEGKDAKSHYCAIICKGKVFIIPREITFDQAQKIMTIPTKLNEDGVFSTWTKEVINAYRVASVCGEPEGPEIGRFYAQYGHYHTNNRQTPAHSFFGEPLVK